MAEDREYGITMTSDEKDPKDQLPEGYGTIDHESGLIVELMQERICYLEGQNEYLKNQLAEIKAWIAKVKS